MAKTTMLKSHHFQMQIDKQQWSKRQAIDCVSLYHAAEPSGLYHYYVHCINKGAEKNAIEQ